MHFVITGFDAFESAEVNASQQAVERVDQGLLKRVGAPDVGIVTHTLATCCNDAWDAMRAQVGRVSERENFAVVMAGLAGNRNRICLERFALNVRSYRIFDNRGHRWQEEYIDEKAPDALRCKLPLFDLAQHLNDNGLMSDISNYAGSFVCNETYFRTMQKWHDEPRCKGVIFVHFPNPVDYVGTNPDAKVPADLDEMAQITEKALDAYAVSIAEIVKFIAVRSANTVIAGA